MAEQLNPQMSAERGNRFLSQQMERFRARLLYAVRNCIQDGYFIGTADYKDKSEKLQQLLQNHQRNLQIIYGNSWEGDKIRAQRELIDEQKLSEEMLGASQ